MENGEEEEERERVRYLLVFYSKPYAKNAVSHFLTFSLLAISLAAVS